MTLIEDISGFKQQYLDQPANELITDQEFLSDFELMLKRVGYVQDPIPDKHRTIVDHQYVRFGQTPQEPVDVLVMQNLEEGSPGFSALTCRNTNEWQRYNRTFFPTGVSKKEGLISFSLLGLVGGGGVEGIRQVVNIGAESQAELALGIGALLGIIYGIGRCFANNPKDFEGQISYGIEAIDHALYVDIFTK
jgi:hypothetical protein